MFGILPEESLADLLRTAKYGLNPDMTAHIQDTIALLKEGKNEQLKE